MESNNESPDVKSKALAILSAAKEPISKELLMKWLVNEWGVDSTDSTIDTEIENVLNSSEVVQTEVNANKLYIINPENKTDVIQRIGDLQTKASRAIASAGLKRYGTKRLS